MAQTIENASGKKNSDEKAVYEKPVLTCLSTKETETGPTAGAENGFSSS